MKTSCIEETAHPLASTDGVSEYLENHEDFIPDGAIEESIRIHENPDPARVREILAKALEIRTLTPDETALLLNVRDPQLWEEMARAASRVKTKVYDNRIVTFAPLYLSNHCVNDCLYCGFRRSNRSAQRKRLDLDEIRAEVEVLAGKIGHKRLIVVYGEHPSSGLEYMQESIRAVYSVRTGTLRGTGTGQIRRVNVNAAPLSVDELRELNGCGLGTFQVFQETYHRETYARMHPAGTRKADFRWRLYAMHRALEAGIDDVGLGVLFGLADWRFEVMGLVHHAHELERRFGIGPHTLSFPRLEPAQNAPFASRPPHPVSDEELQRIVIVLRLAVPYAGMILTARESAAMRRRLLPLGVTQTDASTRIGVGAYRRNPENQEEERQQFMLGDTRSLDELIRELAQAGSITSFCTAGYRCGRTGKCIMDLLRSGAEGKFCKLNAVLTFKEWIDDFASDETRVAGEAVLASEIEQVRERQPRVYERFLQSYRRVCAGERDVYF